MEEMDKYYMEHPTAGVLTMVNMLALMGIVVNQKRVRRLLRLMGINAIYPKKCLSKGGCPQYIHPYLLRGMEVVRPNQVWSTDISYIPMKGGFMYLYAVIDVYSRFIVGWSLCNTLSATNCHELIKDCVRVYGAPEIINSGQGIQYTTQAWKTLLETYEIKISMDGRGRCKDNVAQSEGITSLLAMPSQSNVCEANIWIERFWRTIKQEHIYLNPAESVDELRSGIDKFIRFYNYQRPHQSLDVLLPAMKYGIAV